MGDIVAPFERTRAKRVETAAGEENRRDTERSRNDVKDSRGLRGLRDCSGKSRNLRLFFCQNSE
jgi:hypothetical protein